MIIIATAMVVTSKTSITCVPLTFLLQLVQFYPSLEETGKNCCRAFATSTTELKQVRTRMFYSSLKKDVFPTLSAVQAPVAETPETLSTG